MSGCQLTASFIFDSCRCGNINAFCEACNKCKVSKENAQDEKLRIQISRTRNCLFDWMMIDEDSDSSTTETEGDIKEHRDTDTETPTQQRRRQGNSLDKEASVGDMEKLDIPTCTQLFKNHILSVKHSFKVELSEVERFCDIDVGFLSTQICGMLNTKTGGSIYLGVKRNGVINGVRLERQKKDKVCTREYGHLNSYSDFSRPDSSLTRSSAITLCRGWQPLWLTFSLWRC